MAGVEGEISEKILIKFGIASNGQIKPTLKTKGRELKRTAGVATSLAEKSAPRNIPQKIVALINAKPKLKSSDIFARCVILKKEKLKPK